MKYLALGLTAFSLLAAYKGWVFNGFEFFVSLKKNNPQGSDDCNNFKQEGNDFSCTMTAGYKLQVIFSGSPKGIKTEKILRDRYTKLGEMTYQER